MWYPSLCHASCGRSEGNTLFELCRNTEYSVFCSYCFSDSANELSDTGQGRGRHLSASSPSRSPVKDPKCLTAPDGEPDCWLRSTRGSLTGGAACGHARQTPPAAQGHEAGCRGWICRGHSWTWRDFQWEQRWGQTIRRGYLLPTKLKQREGYLLTSWGSSSQWNLLWQLWHVLTDPPSPSLLYSSSANMLGNAPIY